MVAVRCQSGQHWWASSQPAQVAKCCNGHGLVKVGWPDEHQPYDEKGAGVCVATLMPEHEVERSARLRALEPSFIAAAQAQHKKAT